MPTTQNSAPKHLTSPYERYIWEGLGIDINIRAERIEAAKRSYWACCLIYFPHYFYLKPAPFHKKLISILVDPLIEMIAIIGFRGSAKSTHASMAYPIWEAIRGEHHFIILINDTGTQRDINIKNIKTEFEENALLKLDFPLVQPTGKRGGKKWTEGSLELTNSVYILGRSRGQKIRGLRYRQWRPSLVIGDDLEDLEWVRKKENRDKTERWLKSEVIPAIEETRAKLVIIGNLLHTDALMVRLKRNKLMRVLQFPLIHPKTKEVTWKAKYPTQAAVDKQRDRIGKQSVWLREYLLKIVPEEGAVVEPSDIHYYDEDPSIIIGRAKNAGTGVDLAISEKSTADFTAMVSGVVVHEDGRDVLYVLPNPVQKRLDLYRTIEHAKSVRDTLPSGALTYVEDVAYQKAAIKEMVRKGLAAVGIRPISDKRARFETAAVYIKAGQVRFPRALIDALLTEMFGFGIEDHDDLVDALCILIFGLLHKKRGSAGLGRGDKL